MENEIWKDIKGYEGYYQVSNLGRIKSISRKKIMPNGTICSTLERILRPSRNKAGYYSINLYKNSVRENHFVHRLVAETFIDNALDLPVINHKDEIKSNNTVNNLEWCDNVYNNNYGTKCEKTSKARSKTVYQYDINGNLIKIWTRANERAKAGFCLASISRCCLKRQKQHKGFIWSYEKLY